MPYPRLARPCSSIADALKLLRGPGGGPAAFAAEHKYDGQRAQLHRAPCGSVRIFSRKLDDMTSKYPDVVAALQRSARSSRPFVADAEIVPLKAAAPPGAAAAAVDEAAAADSEAGAPGAPALGTFQSLSTRKRKGVTTGNAAAASVPVCLFLFDLLLLGDESLLARPLRCSPALPPFPLSLAALSSRASPQPSLVSTLLPSRRSLTATPSPQIPLPPTACQRAPRRAPRRVCTDRERRQLRRQRRPVHRRCHGRAGGGR